MLLPVCSLYLFCISSVKFSIAFFLTRLIVHPPKPPPIIREPYTPFMVLEILTKISSSLQLTSYKSRSPVCDSYIFFPKSLKSLFTKALQASSTRLFSSITNLQRLYTTSLISFLYFSKKGRSTSLRRSEEHTSELQSRGHLVCRLLLEKKKTT